MTSLVTSTPAGTPSSVATSAGPCDSPAVSQRNTAPVSHEAAAGGGDAGHANGPEGHCLPGAVRSLWRSELLAEANRQPERLVSVLERRVAVALRDEREGVGKGAAERRLVFLAVPGDIGEPDVVLVVVQLVKGELAVRHGGRRARGGARRRTVGRAA